MTRDESKKILRIITATYQNAYKDSPQRLADAITVWAVIFKDVPYDEVQAAVYTYINEDREYPPTPGQVKSILYRIEHYDEMPEGDAWNLVLRALGNGLYGAQEEFDRLPEDVQRAVGSPQWIHAVAMDDNANMSVESSNFYKRYRQVLANKRQTAAMPPMVKELVEQLTAGKGKSEAAMLEDKRAASAFEYEERRKKAVEEFLSPKEEPMSDKTITSIEMLKERLANGRYNDQNA